MRVVCMCQRGNVRSAGLAYLLKDYYGGHDAVAIGWQTAGTELKDILFKWADKIIVLEPYMVAHVPAEYKTKMSVYDVGPDVYGTPHNPKLHDKLKGYLNVT